MSHRPTSQALCSVYRVVVRIGLGGLIHGAIRQQLRYHVIGSDPLMSIYSEPTGGSGLNCVWKTYNSTNPGWHDVSCAWTSQEGFGQMHALCQTEKVVVTPITPKQ